MNTELSLLYTAPLSRFLRMLMYHTTLHIFAYLYPCIARLFCLPFLLVDCVDPLLLLLSLCR